MTWSGDEIRRRRLAKGLTQQQLADAIAAGRRSIVEWEKDDTPAPSGRNLTLLEEVLRQPEDNHGTLTAAYEAAISERDQLRVRVEQLEAALHAIRTNVDIALPPTP